MNVLTGITSINDVKLKVRRLFDFRSLLDGTQLYDLLVNDRDISATNIDFNPNDYGYTKLTTNSNKEYYIQDM